MAESTKPVVDLAQQGTAPEEHRFHSYVGNRIPWYVRLIWLCFWVFAIYYVITYLFPDLQSQFVNRR